MLKKNLPLLGICLVVLLFFACVSTPAANSGNSGASPADAMAAAQAALDRMDGKPPAGGNTSAAGSNLTAAPAASTPAAQGGTDHYQYL